MFFAFFKKIRPLNVSCFPYNFTFLKNKLATSESLNCIIGVMKILKGVFWFLASLVVGVFLDVIQKKLGQHLTGEEITFFRFLLAGFVLLPFIISQGIKDGFRMTPYLSIHFFRGILLFSGMVLWCYGLQWVPISTAIVLNYSIPLFTLILSIPILKEKVSKERLWTTVIGFIGIIIVLNPNDISFDKRSCIILISSFLFALLDVFNKKYVCKESMRNMLFYTALFTCVLSAYPAIRHYSYAFMDNLWLLFVLGIGANLIFYCLLKAFTYMDASALAPFRYCDFFVSALLGFLFFQEKPSYTTYIGFAIVVPCTLFLTYKEAMRNK